MQTLFDVGPKIDKHIESILSLMLDKLPNNNPSKDSNCYLEAANFINEIYTGMFLKKHQFDFSKDNQYNTDGNMNKIREACGDWIKVRSLILNAINNLEISKDKNKLPWNKKYINSITFAKFFDYGKTNASGLMDSPFLKFINEPKDCYAYTSDLTIDKLKQQTSSLFRNGAEKFSKKYFKEKSLELSFWYNMIEWTEWFKRMKKYLPQFYSEFMSECENDPFKDYTDFLVKFLKSKEGDNISPQPYHFRLVKNGESHLSGLFMVWIRNGIETNKFEILKHLPRSIDTYYAEDSFVYNNLKEKKEKEVIDAEDIFIF